MHSKGLTSISSQDIGEFLLINTTPNIKTGVILILLNRLRREEINDVATFLEKGEAHIENSIELNEQEKNFLLKLICEKRISLSSMGIPPIRQLSDFFNRYQLDETLLERLKENNVSLELLFRFFWPDLGKQIFASSITEILDGFPNEMQKHLELARSYEQYLQQSCDIREMGLWYQIENIRDFLFLRFRRESNWNKMLDNILSICKSQKINNVTDLLAQEEIVTKTLGSLDPNAQKILRNLIKSEKIIREGSKLISIFHLEKSKISTTVKISTTPSIMYSSVGSGSSSSSSFVSPSTGESKGMLVPF